MKKVKARKKELSLVIALMMVLSILPIAPGAYATSAKQYTINVGEKIEVSDITDSVTVRAESSNSSVASVSDVDLSLNNGCWQADYSITGVSEGTATITLYDVFEDTIYSSYTIIVSEHSYTDYVVQTIGSCSEDGIITYTCGKCGYQKTVNTGKDKNNHSGTKVTVNAKDASCGKGYSGDIVCSDCRYVYSYGTYSPAINDNHTIVIDAAVEPTKTSTGLTEGSHCSVCGMVIKEQESIPMITEPFTSEVISKDTTISQNTVIDKNVFIQQGCTLYVTETSTFTVNGDVYVFGNLENRGTLIVNGTLNTLHYNNMLSAGNYNYSYVYNYGEMSADKLNVTNSFINIDAPCVEHDWKDWQKISEATCTNDGKEKRECSICGEFEYKTIPALSDHVWGEWKVYIEATCSYDGEMVRYCEACYESEFKSIPAGGHDWGEWTVWEEATCGDDGIMERECKECSKYEENIIPATGNHEWELDYVKKDSCTSGWQEVHVCKACYEYKYITIPAGGHDWGEWTVWEEATCGDDGIMERECKECSKYEENIIPATGNHEWEFDRIERKSCFAYWYEIYECKECAEDKKVEITPTGHDWSDWYLSSQATADYDGIMYRDCENCFECESKTIYAPKNVKLSKAKYVYDGKIKNPNVVVKDRKGNAISSKYYTVTKPSGRKNVGKYTYIIKFKGNYSGTQKVTFTIQPKATSVSKLTAGKKAFSVKLSKVSMQATGYEIMYATNSKFTKDKKTAKVTSYNTTNKKIGNLTSKKTYYVKARTYKTVNGVKIYSDWSNVKYVKTK